MRRVLGVLVVTIATLLGLELALPVGGHWPPGTSAAFGLLGCAAIVGAGKGLVRLGLQRPGPTDE